MNVAKRGAWCSVPKCPTNVNKNAVCDFFSFPKNPRRAMQWVLKIGRKDLLQKDPADGFPGCKICSMHFEEKVFANSARTALKRDALPTIFRKPLSLHQPTKAQNQRSTEFRSLDPPIVISSPDTSIEEPFSPPPSQQDPLLLPSDIEPTFEENDQEVVEVNRNDVIQRTAGPQLAILWPITRKAETVEVGSQTDDEDKVAALREQVQALQNQIRKLKKRSHPVSKDLGVPEFVELARKLLPLHVAEFVEAQCNLGSRRANNRKYTTEFLEFASMLYSLGPKAYTFMSSKFTLPTVKLLQCKSQR